ncbi:MAG: hypothetical protein LC725_12490, partial [Lentisphaerae bacterium]|nr:hypothetical protein [Lentisphaerota bacterium]
MEHNVRIVQVNLLPFQYGIEGPNIYAYLRLGVDPCLKTADELYQEYVEAAFREAETPMRRFFAKAELAANLYRNNSAFLWKRDRDVLRHISIAYTPGMINAMEEDLQRAEQAAVQPKVKNRLSTVRGEFDVLRHVVDVIYSWYNYENKKDAASYAQVLDAVDARNRQLEEMIARKRTPYNPTYISKKGFGWGVDRFAPFNWDTAKMRQQGVVDIKEKSMSAVFAETALTLDAPAWKNVEAQRLGKPRGSDAELHADTSFQVMYNKDNLYIRVSGAQDPSRMQFESRGRDAEIWLAESVVINLSPKDDKSQYYYLTYEPADNSFADAEHGVITDAYDPRYGWNDWRWNGDWQYENKLDPEKGTWESMATIPFRTLKTDMPAAGTIWGFNIFRVHFYPETNGKPQREIA